MQEFRCHFTVNTASLYYKHKPVSNAQGIIPVCCIIRNMIIAHYEKLRSLMSFKFLYIFTTIFRSANENVN